MEEGRLKGVGEGEPEEALVLAVGEDKGGPFSELGAAGGEGGLGRPEWGEVVDWRECDVPRRGGAHG